MTFSLDGDVAVVTGAQGKLGAVWIETLLEAGATVAALDLAGVRPSPAFEALCGTVPQGALLVLDCDVTDRASIAAAHREVAAKLGAPTILVNNAGIDQPPDRNASRFRIQDVPVEDFRMVLDVNLTGTFQVTQEFGAAMVERGKGSIINVGSLYASVSPDQRFYDHFPGDPPFLKPAAYAASKAGVVHLTRYFATMWGGSGVRVNALSPGGVLGNQEEQFKRKFSERVPLGRMAEAGELKGPLLFLASSAASYVTGHELRVDGGFSAW